MKEKKSMFAIDALMNIIAVYFDTFFIFYFFTTANYEIVPLAKYYLTDYIFTGIGFFLIRNAMKRNIKVPYFQIGISLQALFIALIMLLKENMINYIFLLGAIKGIANGFYHFPRNILESEKVDNATRREYDGKISTINQITSIIIPIILGILLTHFSYTDIGKVVFLLFIVMFIIAFNIKDKKPNNKKFEFKAFMKIVKEKRDIKLSLLIPFLSGFTYSSGVMILITSLLKINMFKTNLNLGFVDSACAILCLLVCALYAKKIKEKHFSTLVAICGVLSFISIFLLAVFDTGWAFIIYLFIRFTAISCINLISDTVVVNLTNCGEIKDTYKSEYYCIRDVIFAISRSLGFLTLLIVSLSGGAGYISYILILPALFILTEAIILSKLSMEK